MLYYSFFPGILKGEVKCKLLSCVWLFVTPWIVAHQAPLSMRILQARILEWVAIASPPGDLPNPRIVPGSPALQADSLSSEPPGKPQEYWSGLKGNLKNLTNTTVWSLRKRNEPPVTPAYCVEVVSRLQHRKGKPKPSPMELQLTKLEKTVCGSQGGV